MTWCSDPLASRQWHLVQIGLDKIYPEYRGVGVRVGIYDDGLQRQHSDLDANYDTRLQLSLEGQTVDPGDGVHGTAVAGVLAAEANGVGGVGVASGASIAGVNIFSGPAAASLLDAVRQMARFDVTNNSWNWSTPFSDNPNPESGFGAAFQDAIAYAVEMGRRGLGTVIVNAAGNEWTTDQRSSNTSGFNQDRHTITVGAVTDQGEVAYYSNRGASVLVSAPSSGGVEGITTTDLKGDGGYAEGDESASFGGTSAATPIVAGVVALMLEANPYLGWRDVQDILSYSADHMGSALGGPPQGAEAYGWSINGASGFNGGGLHFSNDYGFGQVDAYTAVRMAEVWSFFGAPATSANEASASAGGALLRAVSDHQAVTFSFEVVRAIDLEHVDLSLTLSHGDLSQLNIELTSPSGTTSVLLSPGSGGPQPVSDWTGTFGSEAFRGELSRGRWTVRVTDTEAGSGGTLKGFDFDAFGAAASANDVYHYTDEFLALAALDARRAVLTDANGGEDWLNAAGIAGDLSLDLSAGSQSEADGAFLLTIAEGTLIENAVGGDGDDIITGNAAGNELRGMRGADTIFGEDGGDALAGGNGADILAGGAGDDLLVGGLGDDRLDGGLGRDTAVYTGGVDVRVDLALDDVQNTGDGVDTLIGIENLTSGAGSDVLKGSSGTNTLAGGAGADILYGAAGNDVLVGGRGRDFLAGGSGQDRFVFVAISDSTRASAGRDRISGFERGDHIDLSAIDANSRAAGNQRFDFRSDFSGDAGDLQWTRKSGGSFVLSGDVNGDERADFAVQIWGAHPPAAGDFIL